jgi:membrane-associated protein
LENQNLRKAGMVIAHCLCAANSGSGDAQTQLMEPLLMKYGVLAVFAFAALEADVVPVLTGVVVHFGYFGFIASVVAASAGAFAGDCVWFWIGRSRSEWIRRRGIYRRAGNAVEAMAQRFGLWQIPASQVVYGTRMATMIFAGIRGVSFVKFALVDLLGCVTMTTALVTLGFAFSRSAALIIDNVKKVELFLLLAAILIALFFYLLKLVLPPKVRQRPD